MSLKFNNEDNDGNDDLMSAALFVEDSKDKDDDDGKPPQDGMEYLRQVIKERRRVPGTVTADIDPVKISTKSSKVGAKTDVRSSPPPLLSGRHKAAPPPGCCPGVTWQREQVKQFSEVRTKLAKHLKLTKLNGEVEKHKIPDKKNEALWCHLMLGGEIWNLVGKSREEVEGEEVAKGKTDVAGEPPKLGFVTAIPVYVCEQVLEYLISWLAVTGWRAEYGPWVYTLLTRLEKPLTPDVGSLLRDLALFCAQQRLEIAGKVEAIEAGGVPDDNIAALNLFICLVAKYFDQGDLVDREEE
eukprot:GFUD01005227.1.p1 GENE.GFUD01005227.1~~GFUD01005227.1.p1  ORF type:complete len:315 (-),score=127.47 GFUD01005227.1:284-1177(-)